MRADEALIRQCKQSGIIIDTNLLIVWLVERYDTNLISSCRKTSSYTAQDYILINELANIASKTIITPHVLAELSNHTFDGLISQPGFDLYFSRLVDVIKAAQEGHYPKNILLDEPQILSRLGFADHSLVKAAREFGSVVVTDDGKLTGRLREEGHTVLNIYEIRTAAWLAHT